MAGNPFDAFDQAPAAPAGGNPFDAFDAPTQAAPQPQEERPGLLERLGKGLLGSAANTSLLGNLAQIGARGGMAAPDQTPPGGDAIVHPDLRVFDKDIAVPPPQGFGEHAADILGGVLGGMASPEGMVGPSFAKEGAGILANTVRAVGGGGAVMGALNPVTQVARMLSGAQDKFEPEQIPESIATGGLGGGLLHLGAEAAPFMARLAGRLGRAPETVTPQDVHAAAAAGDPDAHAILQSAGVTPEQAAAMSPEFQQQAAERIQARQQADQARSPLQQQAGVEGGVRPGEGAPADRTPEALEAGRQRNIYDLIADGEMDPAHDPTVGRQPDQGAIALQQRPLEPGEQRPQFTPLTTEAPAPSVRPSDVGAMEGINAARGGRQLVPVDNGEGARLTPEQVDEMARQSRQQDVAQQARASQQQGQAAADLTLPQQQGGFTDQAARAEMVRRGYDRELVASLTPEQVARASRRIGGEGPSTAPPMEARAAVGQQPGIAPEGLFRPADLTDAHHPAAGDEADISRGGRQAPPVTDRVTGGTGDRPYVSNSGEPNVDFWRKRAETQAKDLRRAATEGAEPPTETPGWLGGEHAQAEAEITHALGVAGGHPEGRDTQDTIAHGSPGRPEQSVDTSADGHQPAAETQGQQAPELHDVRSVTDQSGVTLDAATEQRAAEHVAAGAEPHEAVQRAVHEDAARVDIEAAEHAAGTHAPEPAERVGPGAEPGPRGDGGPDGPAREQPEPADRAEAKGAPGEPQPAGHAEEPAAGAAPEPEPEPAPEQPEPTAAGGEPGSRPGEPEDHGSPEWLQWHREQSRSTEPPLTAKPGEWRAWHDRTGAEREAAFKDYLKRESDAREAKYKARAEERDRASAEREAKFQREEAERKAERDREQARRDSDWEEILRGHEKRRQQRRQTRGKPSDNRAGDPFLDAEGTPEATAGADDRFDTGKGGVVKSDKGGPITFGDQKQAARWVLKAQQKSPDQVFEVANHPSKGGSYTVRETLRTKPNGSAGLGATLFSNPVGPVASFIFGDAKEWGHNLRQVKDLLSSTTDHFKRPDGQGVVGDLFKWASFTVDSHLRSLGTKFASPEWDRVTNMLHAAAATGKADERTLPEAMQVRINKAHSDLDKILNHIDENKLDHAQVIKQVERPGTRAGATGAAATMIADWLKEHDAYMRTAGVDLGHIRNYFPHAWDRAKIQASKPAFLDAAERAYLRDGLASSKPEARLMADGLWASQVYGDVAKPGMPTSAGQSAPFKERVFSARTNDLLDPFRKRDIGGALSSYARQAARRAEVARRFGDNFANWQDVTRKLEKEGAAGGIEQLQNAVELAAGIPTSRIRPSARELGSWVRTVTTLTLLPKSLMSSLAEPFMVASQTGEFLSGFRALKDTMSQLMRTSGGDPAKLRALATELGVISNEHYNGLLGARYAGGDVVGKRQGAILNSFFKGIGLDQYTAASDTAAMRGGLLFLSRLGGELGEGGAKAKDASFFLRDLGVPEKDHAAFGKFVDGLVQRKDSAGGLLQSMKVPTGADIRAGGKMGDHLTTALNRFTSRAIQRPTAMTKPAWASHEMGKVLFQLQSFNYAYGKNVLGRIPNTVRAVKAGELSGGTGARMLAAQALGGMIPAFAMMAAVGEVRSKMYDSPETQARMSTSAKLERAWSQAGFSGALDPAVQYLGASRYDTGAIDRVVGPWLGEWAKTADSIRDEVFNQPKNPDATGVDRKFLGSVYEAGLEPVLQALMTAAPPSVATMAIRSALIPSLKKAAMNVAGPPSRQSTQPIEGGVTGAMERFWGHFGPGGGGHASRGAFR